MSAENDTDDRTNAMADRHERFAELHRQGTFVLVNAAHAGEAVAAERAGAVAIGTTSSGHADTLGRRDAIGAVSRDEAVERAAQICASVDLPVSVDGENLWAPSTDDIATTIAMLADAGVSGASIEDWSGDPEVGFYDRAEAIERVAAAIEAAAGVGRPFVICARTETFLYPDRVESADPFDVAVDRLAAFADLGVDCVYAPSVPVDLDLVRRLHDAVPVAHNILLPVGSPVGVADLTALGVRRISLGGSLYRAAMRSVEETVRQTLAS